MDEEIVNLPESTAYPLHTPEVQDTIQRIAPDHTDRLSVLDKPGLSSNPDDMEKWEEEQIERGQVPIKMHTVSI